MKKNNDNSASKNWLRGGQIVDHNIRMFKQTAKRVSIASIFFAMAYIVLYTIINTNSFERKLALNYYYSSSMNYIGFGKGVNHFSFNNKGVRLKHAQVAKSRTFIKASNEFEQVLISALIQALVLNFLIYFLISVYIRKRGRREQGDKFIRGGSLVDNKTLKKSLKNKCNQDFSLGAVPILKNTETTHIEISGAPGTGKSQSLKHLVRDIKNRGDRAVIYSSSTEFIADFYDETKDVILNPLDDRSPGWSIWNEAKEVYHYDDIAASLIPENEAGQKILFGQTSPDHYFLMRRVNSKKAATIQQNCSLISFCPSRLRK